MGGGHVRLCKGRAGNCNDIPRGGVATQRRWEGRARRVRLADQHNRTLPPAMQVRARDVRLAHQRRQFGVKQAHGPLDVRARLAQHSIA